MAKANKLAVWMRTSAVSIEGRNELPGKITETSVRIFRSSADVELSYGDTALKALPRYSGREISRSADALQSRFYGEPPAKSASRY